MLEDLEIIIQFPFCHFIHMPVSSMIYNRPTTEDFRTMFHSESSVNINNLGLGRESAIKSCNNFENQCNLNQRQGDIHADSIHSSFISKNPSQNNCLPYLATVN